MTRGAPQIPTQRRSERRTDRDQALYLPPGAGSQWQERPRSAQARLQASHPTPTPKDDPIMSETPTLYQQCCCCSPTTPSPL